MGREVRMVPANWDHPTTTDNYGRLRLQPMYDKTFAKAASEWKAEFAKWEAGGRPDYMSDESKVGEPEYWEYSGSPPEREYYRPWADEEATWFQVWETVSEGSPVSPPFATKDELVEYLAANGDFWDQQRGDGPWTRENAANFVGAGWAPSLIVSGGTIISPRDGGLEPAQ